MRKHRLFLLVPLVWFSALAPVNWHLVAAEIAQADHGATNITADTRLLTNLFDDAYLEPQTAISPDGTGVAYLKSQPDLEGNRVSTELWLAAAAGGAHQRVVSGRESPDQPAWSPDGRWLTYLSARGGAAQIYAWSPATNREVQLTSFPRGVMFYVWSPDGTRLAFTGLTGLPDTLQQRHERFGTYQVVGESPPPLHAHVIVVTTAFTTPQAGVPVATDHTIEGWLAPLSWAPDGKALAFSGRSRRDAAASQDIFVFDLRSGATRVVVSQPGRDRDPRWSPDGQHLAFLSDMARTGLDGWHYELAVTSVTEGSRPHSVSAAFEDLPRPVAWLPSGLFFQGARGVTRHLFRTTLEGRVEQVSAPSTLMAQGFSLSSDGTRSAFIAAELDSVNELHVADIAPFSSRTLTEMKDVTRVSERGRRQVISWTNPDDGETIEGVLITPRNLVPGRRHPLMVVVHGGPQEVDWPVQGGNRIYAVDAWVARGAVVLRPNYRGSGYSKRFRSLAYRGFPAQVDDVTAGISHLESKGLIDASRVGCMGWSHGGYVVAMLATKTTRCRAASVGAATADWSSSYYGSSKELADAYFGASPTEAPQLYRDASVLPFLKNAKTPFLIQHGELDPIVPLAAGYALRQLLVDAGVETEMIVYAGAGHNPGTPRRALTATLHNLWWFDHHIFDGPRPDFTAPPGEP